MNSKKTLRNKKRKHMEKTRNKQKDCTHVQNKDFRMLVVLCESPVNKFVVDEADNELCKHFKTFTNNEIVNTDFLKQIRGESDENSRLFEWVASEEGQSMKFENLFGVIPIWAFLVSVLLWVGVESSGIEFDRRLIENCENILDDINKMVRFTTSNEMGRLANASDIRKYDVASEIGSNFEMVVITGGAEFFSYGKGRCEGTAKKLYDFLASDVSANNGVS